VPGGEYEERCARKVFGRAIDVARKVNGGLQSEFVALGPKRGLFSARASNEQIGVRKLQTDDCQRPQQQIESLDAREPADRRVD